MNDNFDLMVSPVPMMTSKGMTEQASVAALMSQEYDVADDRLNTSLERENLCTDGCPPELE